MGLVMVDGTSVIALRHCGRAMGAHRADLRL